MPNTQQRQQRPTTPFSPTAELLPADPIAQKFLNLFSHRWDFIESAASPVQWRTETKYYLEPRTFWERYLDPTTLLGVRFGKQTSYSMVDIDINSPYHPDNDQKAFKRLLGTFEDIGLCCPVIIRSSYSNGLHIYFFFSESLKTFHVACAMRQAVTRAGLSLEPGTLELFPNTKSYGLNTFTLYNGHRLPLQQGSLLLDHDCQPYSDNVAHFISAAQFSAQKQDLETFKQTLAPAYQWYKANRSRSQSTNNDTARWRQDLENLIDQGWTAFGQTNGILKEIGKYCRVFLGLSEESLWRQMVEIATNCPGYQKWCRHQHEIWQRCRHWAKSIENHWDPLYNNPERQETYAQMMARAIITLPKNTNQERNQSATERIKEAFQHLNQQLITLPSRIKDLIALLKDTTKKLFNITVSEKTLRRAENLPYWHPDYTSSELSSSSEFGVQSSELSSSSEFGVRSSELVKNFVSTDGVQNSELGNVQSEKERTDSEFGVSPILNNSKQLEDHLPHSPVENSLTPNPEPRTPNLEPIASQNPDGHNSDIIQPEALPEEADSFGATPPSVVPKNPPKSTPETKQPETLPDIASSVPRYTPPYMKGACGPQQFEIGFQDKPLVSVILDSNCQQTEIQAPEELWEIIKQAPKLIFTGKTLFTTVQIKGIDYPPQARLLPSNTEVELVPEWFHSQHPILVYVKPTQGAEDWAGGMAVPIYFLKPINNSDLLKPP